MSTPRTAFSKLSYEKIPAVPEERQVPISAHARGWLKIETYGELLKHERQIVERIAATVNGGNLFMAHPFLLLQDIGVELAPRVREEILQIEPRLAALSAVPYEALKASKAKQNIVYHVHGLFPRRRL